MRPVLPLPSPPASKTYIGDSVPRADAYGKVTGRVVFPGDLFRPGMLHLKVLFAGRPHARILDIDISRAQQAPGVVCVLTAGDVPVNNYGLAFNDQPVLCGQVVRWQGDQVAVVVAETEAQACRARDLIRVTYSDLPAVFDPRQARQPGAPALHADRPDNVLDAIRIRKGDVQAGFARAEVVVESHYTLPMQEHAFLQPEAGLAFLDGDTVVVETAGQWAHHDQRQIARSLGLPLKRVRVIYQAIGGAFGGREDISVQIILALAAMRTRRPVKIVWSREESVRGHCKRHQTFVTSRWGATRDGCLVAAEVDAITDAGAYAYTSTMVLGHLALTCTGVYNIPNVKVDACTAYTNNVPGGAFRGFGSPQGVFAAEMQMDKLAAALGMDPVTIREINLLRPGEMLSTGGLLAESIHLDRLLVTCAENAGWKRDGQGWSLPSRPEEPDSPRKTGLGIAIGMKNVGFSFGYPEESSATIVLNGAAEIEEAVVYFAGAECGQGVETAIRQMAAEALSVPLETIHLVGADTGRSREAGSASASRLTLMGGNAIRGASRLALKRWCNEERPAVGEYTYYAPRTTDFDRITGCLRPHVVFSPVAQAVEVEVDIETGEMFAPRVITVVDVGKAINPAQVHGQIEGSVVQALGYTLIENFITKNGFIQTPNLTTYLIPTVLDAPLEVESYLVETPDPLGPWGARGMGETPFITFAPALAGAVHAATGAWFNCLPLVPPMVLEGLRLAAERSTKGSRPGPRGGGESEPRIERRMPC
ncbi:MAG TPA: molybdopterin cofactor-binding domain-containing protein [Anaerolineales bacterium]|nr:molybdopterin cofactor-binding domain-containing protein [Anaerolineales bacterium]